MTIHLYVDGGVVDGEGIYYSVGHDTKREIIKWADRERMRSYTTNNEAEYVALLAACFNLIKRPALAPNRVAIYSDSKLVVEQCNGRWKVKEDRIRSLHSKAQNAMTILKKMGYVVTVRWVPRAENVKRLGH